MNFATVDYLAFMVVVFFVYWTLNRRWQNVFILAASYLFYANWDWRFLGLIAVSTLTNYVCGHLIHNSSSQRSRKLWMVLSLLISLGILGFFKYFNFFAVSFVGVANAVGFHVSYFTLNILLPVGISFYTFQAISYTVDIYRKELEPTSSLIDFAAFVAFFPQLVAGPIVRAKEFVFQLEEKRTFKGEDLSAGLSRFLFGFFKKSFVADTIAINLVDPVFASPGEFSSGTLWLALVGWTVQIYADFSGYSSMAIGSARILGFRIPENFNFPYLSTSIAQYWRRWHMTMSNFFRDYVYIGLGGNRGSFSRTMLNIAITTFVSGLWHGAGWTFVAWGWLHGLYIVINQTWRRWWKLRGKPKFMTTLVWLIPAWIITQLAICLSRILFRSQSFGDAWVFLKGMGASPGMGTIEVPTLVWVAFGCILIDHIAGWLSERRPEVGKGIPLWVRAFVFAGMVVFLYHARPASVDPFIYFQF